MKFFKYIIIAMASLVALVSCEKHGLAYQMEHIDAEDKALVVVWRLIPEASTTANRVYNITIDDQPLWGNNYTYMAARDWMPNQSRHYIMEPGVHNMKWFLKDGTEVYNQNFTAIAGMQEVCVTDYNAAPIVIDNNELDDHYENETLLEDECISIKEIGYIEDKKTTEQSTSNDRVYLEWRWNLFEAE